MSQAIWLYSDTVLIGTEYLCSLLCETRPNYLISSSSSKARIPTGDTDELPIPRSPDANDDSATAVAYMYRDVTHASSHGMLSHRMALERCRHGIIMRPTSHTLHTLHTLVNQQQQQSSNPNERRSRILDLTIAKR